jgi:hypothetical protein
LLCTAADVPAEAVRWLWKDDEGDEHDLDNNDLDDDGEDETDEASCDGEVGEHAKLACKSG